MNISNKFSHWLIALAAVVVVSIVAIQIQSRIGKNEILKIEQEKEHQQIVYGADGKINGEPLTLMPTKLTDEYIFYEDRVVERFYYSDDDITFTIETLNMAFDWVPERVTKYLIVVPSRIRYEENTTTNDLLEMQKIYSRIYKGVGINAKTIDISQILGNKKSEYIYFRIDETWTALGAYYAAEQYLSDKGILISSLDEYEEDKFINYTGTFRSLQGAESAVTYPDTVFFYKLKYSANTQTITSFVEDEIFNEFETPTLALSRRATDLFVGSYYSHTIIQGDAQDGTSVMILGDKYSKIFAPWLIPYYKNICLVDPTYYIGNAKELEKMISEYNVSDFIIMESASMIGYSIPNRRMSHFFEPTISETGE